MSRPPVGLAKANVIRLPAAALRAQLLTLDSATCAESVAEILLEPGTIGGSLMADDLLVCIRGVGPGRADSMLVAADVWGRRRVREITPQRRACLAAMVRGIAAGAGRAA